MSASSSTARSNANGARSEAVRLWSNGERDINVIARAVNRRVSTVEKYLAGHRRAANSRGGDDVQQMPPEIERLLAQNQRTAEQITSPTMPDWSQLRWKRQLNVLGFPDGSAEEIRSRNAAQAFIVRQRLPEMMEYVHSEHSDARLDCTDFGLDSARDYIGVMFRGEDDEHEPRVVVGVDAGSIIVEAPDIENDDDDEFWVYDVSVACEFADGVASSESSVNDLTNYRCFVYDLPLGEGTSHSRNSGEHLYAHGFIFARDIEQVAAMLGLHPTTETTDYGQMWLKPTPEGHNADMRRAFDRFFSVLAPDEKQADEYADHGEMRWWCTKGERIGGDMLYKGEELARFCVYELKREPNDLPA